ncbi:hypothetical protein NDN08_001088 [Rhodosorus marinus]|uniref:Gem-associated protein 6 n=1 Tax=Rhodosorus marinus TaxID=101924 RepID=A0AAV8UPU1_9RHOD|nr:hypothetical protein NDN08_001088 [Rhodosorus marinus]
MTVGKGSNVSAEGEPDVWSLVGDTVSVELESNSIVSGVLYARNPEDGTLVLVTGGAEVSDVLFIQQSSIRNLARAEEDASNLQETVHGCENLAELFPNVDTNADREDDLQSANARFEQIHKWLSSQKIPFEVVDKTFKVLGSTRVTFPYKERDCMGPNETVVMNLRTYLQQLP